jgi:tetratricopeptide (TPR) repeat protein
MIRHCTFGAFGVAIAAFVSPVSGQQPAVVACNLLRSIELQERGRLAVEKKQYAAAASSFQQAFDECPTQHTALLALSEANGYRREFVAAIAAARHYLELEPGSQPGRLALANAYFMAQRLPEALEQAQAVLKAEPAQPTALKLKGNIDYLSGRLDSALDSFLVLLDRYPEDAEAAYMLGRIYYQEGRIDYAIGQFQRELKIDPASYKAYDNLGLCYQANGDTETAIRHFLTAIKLVEKDHPDYDWPYANLADLLVEKGDAENAFAAASKAANRNPYSARNFYLGAKALWKLGKADLCLNWLQRSASLDPTYPEPQYLLARVYTQLGQDAQAKAALERFRALKASAPQRRK